MLLAENWSSLSQIAIFGLRMLLKIFVWSDAIAAVVLAVALAHSRSYGLACLKVDILRETVLMSAVWAVGFVGCTMIRLKCVSSFYVIFYVCHNV